MKPYHAALTFTLTVLMVMLFQLVSPTVAFADGETPPETTPAEGTPPPEESNPPPAEETTAPVDGTAVVEGTKPLLEQLPPETTVVVVNTAGEVEPLATVEAARLVITSDPFWCPDMSSPVPYADGCTASFESFTDLLVFLDANDAEAGFQKNGTIFVTKGDYGGGETDINIAGSAYGTMQNYSLTLQGGLNPDTNLVDSTSYFSAPITITWKGNVSVKDIQINDTEGTALKIVTDGDAQVADSEFKDNNGNGVAIEAGGNIDLDRLVSKRNAGHGASLKAEGNVTVNGGEFEENGLSGMRILNWTGDGFACGDVANLVTLNDVYARWNGESGVSLAMIAGQATINGGKFDDNSLDGVSILPSIEEGCASGDIFSGVTLNNVHARWNEKSGAHLETIAGNASVNGGEFSGNTEHGLNIFVYEDGNVSLIDILAANNGEYVSGGECVEYIGDGANIDTAGNIIIQDSEFTGNNRGVTAESGYEAGSLLEQGSAHDINLSNVRLINNLSEGAYLDALDGNISLDRVYAGGNMVGVDGYACQTMDVSGSVFGELPAEDLDQNYGVGLYATAENVMLNNVMANGNDYWGADLTGSIINVSNSSFNNNGFGGLSAMGENNVTVYNVDAIGNLFEVESGLYIASSGNVIVECSRFNDNIGDGLHIGSANLARLLSVTAEGNGGEDIAIDPEILVEIGKGLCDDGNSDDGGGAEGGEIGSTDMTVPTHPAYATLTCVEPDTQATLTDENGNVVTFHGLCDYDARLLVKTQPELDGPLPEGNVYISGLHVNVLEYGQFLTILPTGNSIMVSFKVPEGALGKYSILWWDWNRWADLGGEWGANGTYFQVSTDKAGTFILVRK